MWNKREVVQFTWDQIKSFMNKNEQVEYLTIKTNFENYNLFDIAIMNSEDKDVKKWVKNIMSEYKIQFNDN